MTDAIASLKSAKRAIVDQYAKANNTTAAIQVFITLGPLVLLWYMVSLGPVFSYGLVLLATVLMSLLLLRIFVLMHECGHGSLFATPALNKTFGFIFGVLSGMPQYVWTQHHNYHHATNGDWAKYRGPLATLSTDEYEQLSESEQHAYVRDRRLIMAPLGGLMYLLVSPRWNWLRGSVQLCRHILRERQLQPQATLRSHAATFETGFWSTPAEYWHMTANNLVLIASWIAMSMWLGPLLFFPVYVVSIAISGGAGIVLFTVQHNFEHSFATGTEDWDYDKAALHGTSHLDLPPWLNWVTASIGYHHVHHLSARIPNYRLADCHAKNAHLFESVRRLTWRDIAPSMRYILWDKDAQRIISIAEHETRMTCNA